MPVGTIRRMIVWGVDTACDRLSVAVMDADTRELLRTESCGPVGSSAEPEMRLGDLLSATRTLMDKVADDHPPAIALIEQPRGSRGNQGVLLAGWGVATAAAARVASRYGSIVQWVEISTWRTDAGLYQLAERTHVMQPIRSASWKALASRQAREYGYTGKHLDEQDAVCIALAACAVADRVVVSEPAPHDAAARLLMAAETADAAR